MNTCKEFNEKYVNWLEPGFYGLAIDDEDVVNYLDTHFTLFVQQHSNFSYAQIKTKFSSVRFYCTGPSEKIVSMIERDIEGYLRVKNHGKW